MENFEMNGSGMEEQMQDRVHLTWEQAERERKTCEHYIKLGDALGRLTQNEDFKLLIQEEYLKEEAVRLVDLLTEQTWMEEKAARDNHREKLHESLLAISYLNSYFIFVGRMRVACMHKMEQLNNAVIVNE